MAVLVCEKIAIVMSPYNTKIVWYCGECMSLPRNAGTREWTTLFSFHDAREAAASHGSIAAPHRSDRLTCNASPVTLVLYMKTSLNLGSLVNLQMWVFFLETLRSPTTR